MFVQNKVSIFVLDEYTCVNSKYCFEIFLINIFNSAEDLLAHGDGCVESEAGVLVPRLPVLG